MYAHSSSFLLYVQFTIFCVCPTFFSLQCIGVAGVCKLCLLPVIAQHKTAWHCITAVYLGIYNVYKYSCLCRSFVTIDLASLWGDESARTLGVVVVHINSSYNVVRGH